MAHQELKEETPMHEVRCVKCNYSMWEADKPQNNAVCGDCAKTMSAEELKGKEVFEDYPSKCHSCKKVIDYDKDYPNGRKDIEICAITYDGEVEGKNFCSPECFNKYVKQTFEETQIGKEEDGAEFTDCFICGGEVSYPSYSFQDYANSDDDKSFCSDKCLRAFLKDSVKN
ncbi:MAG: hypothetical protein ABH864_05560 [archaeon]